MITLLTHVLGFLIQSGGNNPPEPRLSEQGYSPDGVQLPIDGELWILLILGLMLGVYFLYKYSAATDKASSD